MEEKKNTGMVITLIFFIILTLILGSYIVYDKVLKKEPVKIDNISETDNKENENNKLYHIVDGEKFTIYGKTPGIDNQLVNRNKEISFAYPVVDINSDEIKEINNEISKMYQETYNKNLNSETDDDSSCIAIKKDDKYYGGTHIFYNTHKIFENNDYLSIIIINISDTECAGGDKKYTGYVINKNTKDLMTNKEILKIFKEENNEEVYINRYNENANIFDTTKASTIDDINILIYNNQLIISLPGNSETLEIYNPNTKEFELYNE